MEIIDPPCAACGHAQSIHHARGTCLAHDSEGPCGCDRFIPCTHVPWSRTVHGWTCACGEVVTQVKPEGWRP